MKNPNTPSAIDAYHSVSQSNEDVQIYKGKINLRNKVGKTIIGDGEILFKWLPSPTIRFQFKADGISNIEKNIFEEIFIDIPKIDVVGLRALILSNKFNSNSTQLALTGRICEELPLQEETLTELFFDVPNYLDYFGKPIIREEKLERGRLILEADGWIIKIDTLNDVNDRINVVKSTGGYIITHAGKLCRVDHSSFSFEETIKIRRTLTYWLAFSNGKWSSPLFWRSNKRVQYSIPALNQWRVVSSWFPLLECGEVPHTFNKLFELLTDKTWKDSIGLAIYWYIHANTCSGGVEGSLVLNQTALEMLAWTYLVESENILSNNAWKKLGNATSRIERLLKELELPTHLLQSECPNLYAWSRSAGEQKSGPQAIVDIRNTFVHPTSKNLHDALSVSFDVKVEAWKLSLLYLESIILSLLEYEGPIYSRFRSGLPAELKVNKPWLSV